MFVVQDGSCSDGGSGTPLSDQASLLGLDLQNHDCPEQNQDQDSQEGRGGGIKDMVEVESSSSRSWLVAEDRQTEMVWLFRIIVSSH